jgi:hypothetical protein
VKHSFLLDENLFYHSVKGVDLYGNLDLSSTQLVVLIAQNCHSIRYNTFLLGRYRHHLSILKNEKSKILDPVFFERLFFGNSLKAVREDAEPPKLPANARIPNEDVDVVRAALVSHPKFISNDPELREAINGCQQLHLTALTPQDAMQFASET